MFIFYNQPTTMAPNLEGSTFQITDQLDEPGVESGPQKKYRVLVIVLFVILHVGTLFALFNLHKMKLWTLIYTIILIVLAIIGTTAGAHRLWSHRSYEATWPLRLFLFCCCTLCSHITIYDWARLHRLHHKYADTDADPHNSKRGFFFAHIGWLMLYRTPECRKKIQEIDMSDVLKDPFVRFHSKYFYSINHATAFLPLLIPVFVWEEDPYLGFLATCILRLFIVSHSIFSINSIAHMYGLKPYNKRIQPTETALVSFLALGEGWHNYHHTFPWDYKAGEFGDRLNLTARFLDLCAKLGLAYNLKTTSPDMVAKTKEKYGDGRSI